MSAMKCYHPPPPVPPPPSDSSTMTVVLPPLVPQLPSPGNLLALLTLLALSRLRRRPSGRPIHLRVPVYENCIYIPGSGITRLHDSCKWGSRCNHRPGYYMIL